MMEVECWGMLFSGVEAGEGVATAAGRVDRKGERGERRRWRRGGGLEERDRFGNFI